MSVILSSETGDAARVLCAAPDGDDADDERLAISRASSAAPTCRPAGRAPLLRAPRLPDPFASSFVPVTSGDPDAPGFPCGVAAKVPRRLPPGTVTVPVGATG